MAKWLVYSKRADFDAVANEFSISPMLARIIRNRELIEYDEIRKFLNGSMEDLYSPYLLKDMENAVALIHKKIKENQRIRVIGDYDVDGICSSYILKTGLSACGAQIDVAIPHRIRDGYGINEALIREAYEDGIDTIITCDNGISASAQIEYAKQLGMTVIITDHHEVPFEDTEAGRRF
ncbi:MAG: DHH family phosphoesterase, partial [Lachnospiraceae bacterium]|nr:DHH family phosphoesterase [Lachnospiraceae bacterium]